MAEVSALKAAIEEICSEKNIPYDSVIETIEAALAVAYRKDFGQPNENVVVEFDPDSAQSKIFDLKTVVEDALKDEYEAELKKRSELEAEGKLEAYLETKRHEEEVKRAALPEGTPMIKEERFDPRKHVALSDAKANDPNIEVGGEIKTALPVPEGYGRVAAQTAKQVIIQRIREAERDIVYKEYKGREGEILTAMVQRVEGRMVLIDLGHATAIMPPSEQVARENYRPGDRIKVFLVAVNMTPKGPEIVVSRAHPEMVKHLFTVEVPELQNNSVMIKGISREAGLRTKIAVASEAKNIDPVGSLVGQRGTRVQTVIGELGGEKIDIIEWSDDAVKYIAAALSPAKVISIRLDEEQHAATVEVKDDQLSLAIGKSGQNVRLASKLTGWKIDLVGESGERPAPDADGDTPEGETESVVTTDETVSAEASPVAEEPTTESKPGVAESPTDESTTT